MKILFQQNIIHQKVIDWEICRDCSDWVWNYDEIVNIFLKTLNTFSLTDTLALPKLNLQFLTLHDYLLRNLNLFRLESTCNEFFLKYCLHVFDHLMEKSHQNHSGMLLCYDESKELITIE